MGNIIVRLKNDWFGPNGVRYRTRDGLIEMPDYLRAHLPSSAVVVSQGGTLPDKASPAIPGFGAKPAFEQALDKIPGAAPTHLIETAGSQGHPQPRTEGELRKLAAEQAKSGPQRLDSDLKNHDPEAFIKGLEEGHLANAAIAHSRGDFDNEKRALEAAKQKPESAELTDSTEQKITPELLAERQRKVAEERQQRAQDTLGRSSMIPDPTSKVEITPVRASPSSSPAPAPAPTPNSDDDDSDVVQVAGKPKTVTAKNRPQ